jgi:hypothetical protein
MPTDAELFDEALPNIPDVSKAKRLSEERIQDEEFRGFVADLKRDAKILLHQASMSRMLKRPFPRIVFDVTDATEAGAFAFKYADSYFISINLGLIAILCDLFLRLWTLPDVLLPVGDSSREQGQGKGVPLEFDAKNRIISENNNLIRFSTVSPNCPMRKSNAYSFARMSLEFVFFHELRHILAGHLDYRGYKYGAFVISEFPVENTDLERRLVYQATEFDADGYGAHCLMHEIVKSMPMPILKTGDNKVDNDNFEECKRIVATCFVSIDMFFKFYSVNRPQHASAYWNMDLHPPVHLRRLTALGAIRGYFQPLGVQEFDNWLKTLDPVARAARITEGAVGQCFSNAQSDVKNIASAFTPEAMAHFKQLEEEYLRIEPELSNYSFVAFPERHSDV